MASGWRRVAWRRRSAVRRGGCGLAARALTRRRRRLRLREALERQEERQQQEQGQQEQRPLGDSGATDESGSGSLQRLLSRPAAAPPAPASLVRPTKRDKLAALLSCTLQHSGRAVQLVESWGEVPAGLAHELAPPGAPQRAQQAGSSVPGKLGGVTLELSAWPSAIPSVSRIRRWLTTEKSPPASRAWGLSAESVRLPLSSIEASWPGNNEQPLQRRTARLCLPSAIPGRAQPVLLPPALPPLIVLHACPPRQFEVSEEGRFVELGSGTFATVFLTRLQPAGTPVAAKVRENAGPGVWWRRRFGIIGAFYPLVSLPGLQPAGTRPAAQARPWALISSIYTTHQHAQGWKDPNTRNPCAAPPKGVRAGAWHREREGVAGGGADEALPPRAHGAPAWSGAEGARERGQGLGNAMQSTQT